MSDFCLRILRRLLELLVQDVLGRGASWCEKVNYKERNLSNLVLL
jgi:hypothetical protein